MNWRRIVDTSAPVALPTLLLCALAVPVKLAGTSLLQHSMVEMLVMLVVVVGIYVFVGNSGILSFGHVSFMAIGAYATAWLTLPLPLKKLNMPGLPSFLHALSVPVTASAIVSAPVRCTGRCRDRRAAAAPLRNRGKHRDAGFLVIVYVGYSNWDSVTLGTSSIVGLPPYTNLWTALAWAVAMIFLAYAYTDFASRPLAACRARRRGGGEGGRYQGFPRASDRLDGKRIHRRGRRRALCPLPRHHLDRGLLPEHDLHLARHAGCRGNGESGGCRPWRGDDLASHRRASPSREGDQHRRPVLLAAARRPGNRHRGHHAGDPSPPAQRPQRQQGNALARRLVQDGRPEPRRAQSNIEGEKS